MIFHSSKVLFSILNSLTKSLKRSDVVLMMTRLMMTTMIMALRSSITSSSAVNVITSSNSSYDFSTSYHFHLGTISCCNILRYSSNYHFIGTFFTQAIIPESITVANERGLDEAILLLLGLEKKCRVNNDFTNLKEVCLHMVRLCRSKSDWGKLNSTLAVINKR